MFYKLDFISEFHSCRCHLPSLHRALVTTSTLTEQTEHKTEYLPRYKSQQKQLLRIKPQFIYFNEQAFSLSAKVFYDFVILLLPCCLILGNVWEYWVCFLSHSDNPYLHSLVYFTSPMKHMVLSMYLGNVTDFSFYLIFHDCRDSVLYT